MSLKNSPDCGEELELDTLLSPAEDEAPDTPEVEAEAPAEPEAVPSPEEALTETDELVDTPAETVETVDEPADSIDEPGEPEPQQKRNLPRWLTLSGALIVAALFIFLFVLVLGDHEAIDPPAPTVGNDISVSTAPTAELTEPTVPPTAPPDGNPDDITCLGSYSVTNTTNTADDVVAALGEKELTNAQLQVYYWQEVYRYLTENSNHGISLNHTLDVQMCTVSDTPMTWQQYFLQRAIETWQIYQALALDSDANEFGLDESYRNYLNSLPEALEQLAVQQGYADADAMIAALAGSGVSVEDYTLYVRLYEEGHIYFDRVYQNTTPSSGEIQGYYSANADAYADISGKYVDVRHIMLVPDGTTEEAWDACKQAAEDLLRTWKKNATDVNFADLAFEYSADPGSNHNGGLYANVYDGLFASEINDWCFDSSRRKGDTEIFKTKDGYHILYFSASRNARDRAAELDLIADTVSLLVPTALQNYPLAVDYSAIAVADVDLSGLDAEGIAGRWSVLSDLCQDFPDVSYQRYPTIPLYIQQDYAHLRYGGTGDTIASHGCGIAALAMAATYLTDTEHTIEELTQQFIHYGTPNGSSWALFDDAPVVLGFHSYERTRDWEDVLAALEAGKLVINLQRKGAFTTGGHYILLYGVTDDGKIMIRDSDLNNHAVDFADTDYYENGFPPELVNSTSKFYWILESKVTQIAACARCGDTETEGLPTELLLDTYCCPKCCTALHLREIYDSACDIDLVDTIVPPLIDEDVTALYPESDDSPVVIPSAPDEDEEEVDEPLPDDTVPEESTPDGSAPDGSAPDGSASDGSTPDTSEPDTSEPSDSEDTTPAEPAPSDTPPSEDTGTDAPEPPQESTPDTTPET